MRKLVSFVRNLVAIILVFAAFYIGCTMMESVPFNRVNPSSEISLEEWILNYRRVLLCAAAGALVLTLVWSILEEWVIGPKYLMARSSRSRWLFLLFLQAIITAAAILYTHFTLQADGVAVVYPIYAAAGLVPFYLSTLLFSPTAIKYSAPLSCKVRIW